MLWQNSARLSHHVRHRVDVDGLILVMDEAADVAEFQNHVGAELALDCQVPGVHSVGPEMRIERLPRSRCRSIDAGKIRLRKSRSRCSDWGGGAIDPDAEGISGGRVRRTASAVSEDLSALYGLNKPGAQQGNENQVHAVQTAIDAAIAGANDGTILAKDAAHEAAGVEVRIPSQSDSRAERAVKRIVGILLMVSRIPNESETDWWIIDLPLQGVALALCNVGSNVDLLIARVHQFDLLPLLFCRRHLKGPAKAVGKRDTRLHVPAIAKVHVVIGNGAFVEGWCERGIEGQVGSRARVGNLRVGDYARYGSEVARGCGALRITGRRHTGEVD